MEASDLRELETRVQSGFFRPMYLGGELITVDTTDFGRVDYGAIARAVRSALDRE